MYNDAVVCGRRVDLKIAVRDISEQWKSLESEYVMMFLVTLMSWEYRDTPFLTRVHTIHQATVEWGSFPTGSNESL